MGYEPLTAQVLGWSSKHAPKPTSQDNEDALLLIGSFILQN